MVSAVFLTASNTPSVYAALAQIPVIGDAVRIFHIGSGGQRSDGLKADMEAEEEKLRLVFSQNPPTGGQAADVPAGDTGAGEQAADAPAYHIEQFAAPERIAITVHGIRSCQPEKLIEEAEKCSYIKTAYREMLLDDSAVRIVLELQPGTGFGDGIPGTGFAGAASVRQPKAGQGSMVYPQPQDGNVGRTGSYAGAACAEQWRNRRDKGWPLYFLHWGI